MKKLYITTLTTILLLIFLISSCNGGSNNKKISFSRDSTQTSINNDSVELTALIRKLYKWHEAELADTNAYDFPTTKTDSFYIGIDWPAHQRRLVELKKTNFFSQEFLKTYNHIALQIDSFIKINKGKIDVFGIPDFDSDGDDWCGCQDSPDDYWKTIVIKDLKVLNDSASFKWDWTPSRGDLYSVKTKKIDKVWKVSWLQYFQPKDYLFLNRY
jgi:hypothetical protein